MKRLLKSIQVHVQDAIDKAQEIRKTVEDHPFKDEAVNWADLKCTDVRYYYSINGDSGFQAFVEEADPNCSILRGFIYDYLGRLDIDDVEIRTEW